MSQRLICIVGGAFALQAAIAVSVLYVPIRKDLIQRPTNGVQAMATKRSL